jgi:hypothetical protein
MYRVGHAGSHSGVPGILASHVFNRELLKRPKSLIRNVSRLRLVGERIRQEFFGSEGV